MLVTDAPLTRAAKMLWMGSSGSGLLLKLDLFNGSHHHYLAGKVLKSHWNASNNHPPYSLIISLQLDQRKFVVNKRTQNVYFADLWNTSTQFIKGNLHISKKNLVNISDNGWGIFLSSNFILNLYNEFIDLYLAKVNIEKLCNFVEIMKYIDINHYWSVWKFTDHQSP